MRKMFLRVDLRFFESKVNNLLNLAESSHHFRTAHDVKPDGLFFIDYFNRSSELNSLCHHYGTDKGYLRERVQSHPLDRLVHSYADFYELIFGNMRHSLNVKIFECGIGTDDPSLPSSMGLKGRPGASLRVWRDWFQDALVIGADIDKNILFSEPGIMTYYVDQTDAQSVKSLWENVPVEMFDVMIDDGLHTFEAGSTLFENSIGKLSKNGYYVIEDVKSADLDCFRKYFSLRAENVYYVRLIRHEYSLDDNTLVVIRK
jgi:hypothetical protein